MRLLRSLRARFLRGPQFERDLADEVAFHIAARARDLAASGLSEQEALRRARIEFGAVENWKEACRETRSFRPLDELRADLRFAARAMAKSPVFTLTAVLSLAIGIGVNTGIFSLIDGLWLRPMAVRDVGSIVRLFTVSPRGEDDLVSWPEYRETVRQTRSFDGVVAVGGRGARMPRPDGTFELLLINVVSENFFPVLGVKAAHGRLFGPEDSQSLMLQPVVVLGYSFWQRHYRGDRGIIGRQIRLERATGGVLFTVCGVLPPEFGGLWPNHDRDIWMPPQTFAALGRGGDFEQRDFPWVHVLGRLRPGVSIRTANAQMSTVANRLASAWPDTNRGRRMRVVSDLDYRLQRAGTLALVLFGVVFLVVAMSAVNVANLLLARAAARWRELSIRLAIGAGRARIFRQLLVESALLGFGGFAGGALLAAAIIRFLPQILGGPPGYQRLFSHFEFDSRVLLFSMALAAATTFLFGLAPALRASRADLAVFLQQRDPGHLGGRFRSRQWLIAAQVAMSMTLLALTAVCTASFVRTRTASLGMERRELLLVWCGYSNQPQLREAASRLASLPGVREVALAARAPLSVDEGGMAQRVSFPDRIESPKEPPLDVYYNAVSSNFLRVMGTPIVRGRNFDETDQTTGPPVVLISETMASRFWPAKDPIGQIIRIGPPPGVEHRIVGIVKDVKFNSIDEAPQPYLYLPWWRADSGSATFIMRTQPPASTLAGAARRTVIAVDPRLDPFTITTQAALIRFSAQRWELTAELMGILGCIGLLLTSVGLYGVVTWTVTRRTREIGIRMALGATPSQTIGLVLRQTAVLGLCGMAAGLPVALAATRLASSLLFRTHPWDVSMFLVAAAALAAVLLAAGLIPARRATRIDPLEALRVD
jgi:predicted permease